MKANLHRVLTAKNASRVNSLTRAGASVEDIAAEVGAYPDTVASYLAKSAVQEEEPADVPEKKATKKKSD